MTNPLQNAFSAVAASGQIWTLISVGPRTKTESTTAGEQHGIPGAEKVSDAEVAKRKAGQPLKPKVEQKPSDEGLFGDWAYQTDLVDLAGVAPRRRGPLRR